VNVMPIMHQNNYIWATLKQSAATLGLFKALTVDLATIIGRLGNIVIFYLNAIGSNLKGQLQTMSESTPGVTHSRKGREILRC
jgi:hypothetical protein